MTADADQLLAAYPNAAHAVSWCELYMAPSELDDTDIWGEIRRLTASVDRVIAIVREAIQVGIAAGDEGNDRAALAETDTTDFRRYVGAKLGMM